MTHDRPDRLPAPRRRPVLTPARVAAGVLLLVPFVALLWVASYAKAEPRLLGFPFFYWYQLLWVLVAAVLTYAAHRLVKADAQARVRRPEGVGREEPRR